MKASRCKIGLHWSEQLEWTECWVERESRLSAVQDLLSKPILSLYNSKQSIATTTTIINKQPKALFELNLLSLLYRYRLKSKQAQISFFLYLETGLPRELTNFFPVRFNWTGKLKLNRAEHTLVWNIYLGHTLVWNTVALQSFLLLEFQFFSNNLRLPWEVLVHCWFARLIKKLIISIHRIEPKLCSTNNLANKSAELYVAWCKQM